MRRNRKCNRLIRRTPWLRYLLRTLRIAKDNHASWDSQSDTDDDFDIKTPNFSSGESENDENEQEAYSQMDEE
jgi:hypothetical protein